VRAKAKRCELLAGMFSIRLPTAIRHLDLDERGGKIYYRDVVLESLHLVSRPIKARLASMYSKEDESKKLIGPVHESLQCPVIKETNELLDLHKELGLDSPKSHDPC